ncbi:uncharacterized protein A4U43_C03F29640 [Asparagus officinalis]|uniref:Uncharacterized protein n=1 Tax=Asparagus officinalis TaxID=4686 RepID=A0A5P1FDW2_ASPOF|nr:uncharacterized protein A4U43_C03F29640 [Asparagus officinalis]
MRSDRAMEVAVLQSRSSVHTRGPNTAHKLKPDVKKGEKAWPLYLNNIGHPIGDYAEKWGKYVGKESRGYRKYPLHLEWGDEHNRSFDDFFIRCQNDYEFLPLNHDQPLSHHIVYRGMKSQLQERKGQITEDGGTSTMLKLYLGTHSSSVDKITEEYTYPDNNTKEYCVA